MLAPVRNTVVRAVAARAMGRTHRHLELTGSFRCNGSAAYTAWLDNLLYGTPQPWTGHTGYEPGLADDPFQLQEWIDQATTAGHTARTHRWILLGMEPPPSIRRHGPSPATSASTRPAPPREVRPGPGAPPGTPRGRSPTPTTGA
ncbi:hypothetical protein TNCT1_65940 [Streptomyces sp. 1-11]|nr:hypothetical protein TNCT1_65940 [Streptomyces sp. 1-11]